MLYLSGFEKNRITGKQAKVTLAIWQVNAKMPSVCSRGCLQTQDDLQCSRTVRMGIYILADPVDRGPTARFGYVACLHEALYETENIMTDKKLKERVPVGKALFAKAYARISADHFPDRHINCRFQ